MYLGINIVSGIKFVCTFDKAKSKFYASFNAIYSKLGRINNPLVTLHLIYTISLPCLLFATEALNLLKTLIDTLEHPWTRVFMKVFNTFDSNVVNDCQLFSGFDTLKSMANIRKIKFMKSLKNHSSWLLRSIFNIVGMSELISIA